MTLPHVTGQVVPVPGDDPKGLGDAIQEAGERGQPLGVDPLVDAQTPSKEMWTVINVNPLRCHAVGAESQNPKPSL